MINSSHISHFIRVTRLFLFFICFGSLNLVHAQSTSVFDSKEVLEMTLRGDLKPALTDRGENPEYHQASLIYRDGQSDISIPIKIRTRGHYRKDVGNCKYPPILLNFSKTNTPKESIFYGQDKMKLVVPCRNQQYVVNEYLVYELYNLVTPMSFRARFVNFTFEDSVKNKKDGPLFGILIEEEEQMAIRNNSISVDRLGLSPASTKKDDFLTMAVFQYMIGNTDWSTQFLQNVKMIAVDSSSLTSTVPYDFDHAGIVRAPYASPAEELNLGSTLVRRYRGYCIEDMSQYDKVFAMFNKLKPDFYNVYTSNKFITEKYKAQTIKFLDEFYETINDPAKAKKEFSYPCDKTGTGNIVIEGLKKQKKKN